MKTKEQRTKKNKSDGSSLRLISYVAIFAFLFFLTTFKLTLNITFCWFAVASIVVSVVLLLVSLALGLKEGNN